MLALMSTAPALEPGEAGAIEPSPVAGPVGAGVLGPVGVCAGLAGGLVVDGLVSGGGLDVGVVAVVCAIANDAPNARLAANAPAISNAFMTYALP
jgi:hypothetical protein